MVQYFVMFYFSKVELLHKKYYVIKFRRKKKGDALNGISPAIGIGV
ncbi:hypothetical protein JZU68_00655 [bacterium]|nr:hypothetical protein [bacterium]